ncbi:DegT/DnrJ/EryC1/StrS family aminotransferase [Aestuariivivens sediminis]|uniref:DegT/DnrJ/EryC1/StrS family aminotransferase n=1 Tax=Aestuariivivens sediminis TaxID=2913557 RepID=UPI001F58A73D|nr:DegT/DnrJ/EryC1/StrS family aminotransferase [Aestuariivivens sediminis]
MEFKIPLSPPHLSGNELKHIQDALDSNWGTAAGGAIEGLEKDLEAYLGGQTHVAALSSGTAAIHLALILAGVQPGDEVICQSLTFAASAFPILYQGARPLFVDSEPDTWNLCPKRLEEAITDRIKKGRKPRAMIVVHLFGIPAKMDALVEISKAYDIPIIEDAAEALGSEYKGQKCGTFGAFGILSFNVNKIITTWGGGALMCKDIRHKRKAIFLATQAKDRAPWYEHSHVGFNYRMSPVAAAIGRGQMKALPGYMEKRRANHEFYRTLFKPFRYIEVLQEASPDQHANFWLTCIRFATNPAGKGPMGLSAAFQEHGIESKPIWKPMHIQPVFREAPFYGGAVATSIFENGLCLPSGSGLTTADKDTIAQVALNYLQD